MQEINKFKVGDIVSLKTHPLFHDFFIKGDGKYTPPILIVKEVHFEDESKTIALDNGYIIAEKIKYICTYFDDNKSEFVDSAIYEMMLESFVNLKIALLRTNSESDNHIDLIEEVNNYPLMPSYEYGKILYFKTKKLEVFKKRTSNKIVLDDKQRTAKLEKKKKIVQYVVNYATPDFVICGFTAENPAKKGKSKKILSANIVKVKWFNPFKQKFSDVYLPMEFFTDINPFPSKPLL
ncbi:hypothetical protein [Flavobacterium caeni]|uniref:Immunity protein 26 n=1 Tax=Flavobacterium caeni TaxID=490189 RepID=A0A1G5KFF2_9FLAO|nr:hypothetical protein [Flavobacterium caeni]SCY99365.1 hypothetical protein SAMN02927903_03280 [Flavobacterium caeni]